MAKDEVKSEGKVINIGQFFSRKNEAEGVWYEPTISGRKCGIEFKVLGAGSNASIVSGEVYNKEIDEASSIKDATIKAQKTEKALCNRLSTLIIGIRASGGGKVLMPNGNEATKDDAFEILYNSPAIAIAISRFAGDSDNFLGEKKSD